MKTTDLLIIGGGPAGYEIAAEASGSGRQVTLIEKDKLGGTCLNRGCIPTKCLCASAEAIISARNAAAYGVDIAGIEPHYDRAAERMRQVVDQLRQGIDQLLSGVEVVRAEARLKAATADVPADFARVLVEAGGEAYAAKQVLIATGSKPAILPIEGAELAMTSDELLSLDRLPARVAVIGGGVIGMEFASIMAAFGTEVTVIEFCPEILPPFDREVAKRLRTTLGRRGVKTIVGAGAKSIAGTGPYTVTYADKKGEHQIECDAVLMAVGRRPVLPEGCAEAGLEISKRGFIEADDDTMLTSLAGVHAVGDVNGKCMLAHAGAAQARLALGHDVDMDYMPSAVFTLPECAMVGLTEEQCQAEGIDYAKAKSMFASNGKALAMGHADGFVKVLYSPATRLMLGVHIIGPHAADIVAEATACMAQGATVDEVAHSIIHGHPTLSEAFMAACAAAR